MDVFSGVLTDTAKQFLRWAEASGPKLLAAVVILVVGWLIAKLVKVGISRGLRAVKVDVAAQKSGIEGFLTRGNIKAKSSDIIGALAYWLMLLLTLLIGMKAMGLSEAGDVFRGVLGIIPRVFVSVVILILGLSFAGFISDIVQTAAANAQIRQARLLANASRYTITIFVVIMAMTQLQIATEIISQAFLVLFGSACLALALAFGLGCRDLAGRIAERVWEREQAESRALAEKSESADRPAAE